MSNISTGARGAEREPAPPDDARILIIPNAKTLPSARTIWTRWVRGDRSLPPAARLVALTIADMIRPRSGYRTTAPARDIARMVGVAPEAVRRSVQILLGAGWLKRDPDEPGDPPRYGLAASLSTLARIDPAGKTWRVVDPDKGPDDDDGPS